MVLKAKQRHPDKLPKGHRLPAVVWTRNAMRLCISYVTVTNASVYVRRYEGW